MAQKSKSAAIQIRDFEQALELYKLDVGRFPRESDGLDALVREPSVKGWNGPYLKKGEVPEDPWGNAYEYRVSSSGIGLLARCRRARGWRGKTGTSPTNHDVLLPRQRIYLAGTIVVLAIAGVLFALGAPSVRTLSATMEYHVRCGRRVCR